MNWEEIEQAANESILEAISVPIVFVINGAITSSSGVFTDPTNNPNSYRQRSDDYELNGVDARRSRFQLEVLNYNLPPSVCPGTCVEIDNHVYTVTHLDPPKSGSTVLYLIDSGEVT